MTDQLIIIVDAFVVWLLGYRIEFSRLYIPWGHYFISTMCLKSTEVCVFFFLSKVYLSSIDACSTNLYSYHVHMYIVWLTRTFVFATVAVFLISCHHLEIRMSVFCKSRFLDVTTGRENVTYSQTERLLTGDDTR